MTLQETITLTERFLQYDLDGYLGSEAETPDMVVAINWAIRTVAKAAKLVHPAIPITLIAGRSTYDLRTLPTDGTRIVKPRTVIIAGSPLRNAARSAYGLWALTELDRFSPKWRTADSGTPTKAILYGTSLILHPPPDVNCVAEGGHFVNGTYMPADMDEDLLGEELPLPVEVHEAVAYCAAVKLAMPTVGEQAGVARLQAYSAEWAGAIEALARENDATTASWGSTTGSEGEDWLCV